MLPRVETTEPALPLRGQMGILRLAWSRWLGRAAGLALATLLFLGVLEILLHPWSNEAWLPVWRTALAGGIGGAVVLAIASAAIAALRPWGQGLLRTDGADLVMEAGSSEHRAPIASVKSGVVVPSGTGARVELELGSGNRLVADVRGVAEGRRVLESLELDASKRRCTIPLQPRALAVMKRVGLITLAIFGVLGVLGAVMKGAPLGMVSAALMLVGVTAATLLAVRVTRSEDVTIGADGLRLPGGRFVSIETVESVRAEGPSVELTLRDGHREAIRVPSGASADAAQAIALRIDEALRAYRRAPDAQAQLELLSRAGRSLEQWRAALGKVSAQAGSYRAAGLSSDDLAAILQNPSSSPEHRMGAALALASAEDATQKARIRVAADACASEPMRIALGKLANGEVDDGAVEEALAAAEATEEAPIAARA